MFLGAVGGLLITAACGPLAPVAAGALVVSNSPLVPVIFLTRLQLSAAGAVATEAVFIKVKTEELNSETHNVLKERPIDDSAR